MKELNEEYKFVIVFVTTSGEEEGRRIAELLVKERVAACVNIIPKVHSIYWWENKIEEASEFLLIAKSKRKKLDDLIKLVKSVHSYSVPEIIATPILSGNEEYLRWIDDSVK
jgi:periplasmic divalent cation tolerance protein